MRKKSIRSQSGIVNVSVVMPPHRFSCKHNCLMCPDQRISKGADVDMPRSYLSNEDAVRRAADVDFDPVAQVRVRLKRLEENGHNLDKIEVRVLGGTFSSYPHDVAYDFIRDVFYAVNSYFNLKLRPAGSLEEEQYLNETARIRIVGLGLETRPDEITLEEIRRFRRYGCTRVELGVQHTDDRLLRKIGRGHGVRESRRAVQMLKDNGFKVEIHIMTDLPGATPDGDRECYREILLGEDLIPDYLKDYPCLAVDFTEVKKWREDGRWKPYSEDADDARKLTDVLVYRQSITPPWVRVNRIQRDFAPARLDEKTGAMILGYHSGAILSNLGQLVREEAIRRNVYCQCIRCHEIRDNPFDERDVVMMTRFFRASGALEYFVSMEVFSRDRLRRKILGFARLRINNQEHDGVLEIFRGRRVAVLRELHVYGSVVGLQNESSSSLTPPSAQHRGYGGRLLRKCEALARWRLCSKMVIISGVGVREYYRKKGYYLEQTYMVRPLWEEIEECLLFSGVLLFSIFLCVLGIVLSTNNSHTFVGFSGEMDDFVVWS